MVLFEKRLLTDLMLKYLKQHFLCSNASDTWSGESHIMDTVVMNSKQLRYICSWKKRCIFIHIGVWKYCILNSNKRKETNYCNVCKCNSFLRLVVLACSSFHSQLALARFKLTILVKLNWKYSFPCFALLHRKWMHL